MEEKRSKRPCIAKRTISSKKLLYAIFFNSSWPVVQEPCLSFTKEDCISDFRDWVKRLQKCVSEKRGNTLKVCNKSMFDKT